MSDDGDDGFGWAEALVVENRRMVRPGGLPFSCDLRLTEIDEFKDLLRTVHTGAAQLTATYRGRACTVEGQASLIDFGATGSAAENVYVVTALHNVLCGKGVSGIPNQTLMVFAGSHYNVSVLVVLDHFGKTEDTFAKMLIKEQDGARLFWRYGIDITRGHICKSDERFVAKFHTFQAVPENFELAAGMKVAMAVLPKTLVNQDSAHSGEILDQDTLVQIYGVQDEVNVLTGEITEVCFQCFFHNINTYRGLSGAAIFLLRGDHAGWVVGIHCGAPESLSPPMNLAIKIREINKTN